LLRVDAVGGRWALVFPLLQGAVVREGHWMMMMISCFFDADEGGRKRGSGVETPAARGICFLY
jgi:hypothetical protein